ncbi:MAG: sensor histidine kinase [Acidobacteriota bacterium]
MQPRSSLAHGFRPMLFAIAATCGAAGLVLYLQHRALASLEAQTQIILRQIAAQTADDIAAEARQALDGPVFETLTAVNHPEIRAGRLDLIAAEFEKGLEAYPHVERFFVWTAQTNAVAADEALFLGREKTETATYVRLEAATGATGSGIVRLQRDPDVGRAIMQIARQYAPEQHIYVAAADVGPGHSQALLRLFWTDATRVEYFAVLGFIVDPPSSGRRLFAALHDRSIGTLLNRRGNEGSLRLRVLDAQGALVYGDPTPFSQSAVATLPMLFYPADRLESRLSNLVPAPMWHIEVSGDLDRQVATLSRGYGPTVLSVALMLVALGLTVLANRRLADLSRMQADLISHVSHQLKTPLSLLSAAMETVTMDRAKSPEKLAQYLGIMRGEVARLSALVQRILEFSRLQEPRAFEFEPVDLGALVRETVAAFENSLAAQQFRFLVEEQKPTLHITADSAAIEQALVNLLDNAVRYSGASRQVVVRLRSASGLAFIEVVDQGIGIDKADHRRIFDRFYRGRGAALHREGFGLGLPIAQELVRAHRGRVEVESQAGQGSTFRIVVPILRESRAAQRVDTSTASRPEALP